MKNCCRLLIVFLLCVMMLFVAACTPEPDPDEETTEIETHTISTDEQIDADSYCFLEGHTEVIDAAVAPTCTEKGKTEGKHCSVCGEVLVAQEILNAKGHAFGETGCTVCGLQYSSGLEFTANGDGTCYVKGMGTCTDTDICIPKKSPQGDTVTGIGDWAFYGWPNITSIVIPNSVTSIGYQSFAICKKLTSITLFNSITSIGELAFYECESLASVILPNSVKSIGEKAFSDCKSITSITIPGNVTDIGSSVLSGCSALKNILSSSPSYPVINQCLIEAATGTLIAGCGNSIIPTDGSITKIGEGAFESRTDLTTVTIPDGVTIIDGYAFAGCTNLTSVTLPDGLISIEGWAFGSCPSLASITIPDSVTSIGGIAFSGCKSLTNIIIPDSVTSLGNWAFHNCKGLTSVTIGNNVTSIGWSAFEGCTSLTNITIPDSVTNIDHSAFRSCASLTSATIGNRVSSIGGRMFEGCKNLTSVTIGNSVTSIGDYAFYECENLTKVNIPDSVTSIGDYTFQSCTSLTSVVIPNSVTKIGGMAFGACKNLTSVYYTGTVDDWGKIFIDNEKNANTCLINAPRYYYSETKPTTSSDYWRYVDGVPTPWGLKNVQSNYDNDGDGKNDIYSFTSYLPHRFRSANAIKLGCDDHLATDLGVTRLDVPVSGLYHVYINLSDKSVDNSLKSLTWKVTVPENGMYEFCYDMRMKDDKHRGNIMYIDYWCPMSMDFQFTDEELEIVRDESEGSYMAGIFVPLVAGEHTISMTYNPLYESTFHFRNIYLVKVAD